MRVFSTVLCICIKQSWDLKIDLCKFVLINTHRTFLHLVLHLTAAGLAQSVERLTAEQEVAGSIPGAGPILRVLK